MNFIGIHTHVYRLFYRWGYWSVENVTCHISV